MKCDECRYWRTMTQECRRYPIHYRTIPDDCCGEFAPYGEPPKCKPEPSKITQGQPAAGPWQPMETLCAVRPAGWILLKTTNEFGREYRDCAKRIAGVRLFSPVCRYLINFSWHSVAVSAFSAWAELEPEV